MVCTYLIQVTGTIYSIGFYIAFVAIASLIGTSRLKNLSENEETSSADQDRTLILNNPENVKA